MSPSQMLKNADLYVNRELSVLQFQARVLAEASDPRNPLLERLKFLAIVNSNIDEFFMVRVGGLRQLIEAGVTEPSLDGLTPAEQLAAVRRAASKLMVQARRVFSQLRTHLAAEGIHILDYRQLPTKLRENADRYFDNIIFPTLTPLAVDPSHPFPHISNLSLNLAVIVNADHDKRQFARIKVPSTLPRLVPLKRSSGGVRKDGTLPARHYFVWIEQLIIANLGKLFPGTEIVEARAFRVTRDADMAIREIEAADFLELMQQVVRRRQFNSVVRLSVNSEMSVEMRHFLLERFKISENDLYVVDGPHGLSSLMAVASIDRTDLKFGIYPQHLPAVLQSGLEKGVDYFAAIRQGDILLHHPYQRFTPVVEFLEQAAHDPAVLAIKQTLYRVGKNSPIVHALLKARQNRKEVTVLVELQARFDEESNINWAKALEHEGVHVIYGMLGLKTHAKVALVVRREGESIRRYVHMGTGNYNAVTANIYEDLGVLTCDEQVGADATDLFNYLTGFSAKQSYRQLLVAPITLRSSFEALIQVEINHQRQGGNGYIIFKCNAIADTAMIELLYRASQAGVKIDLFVRSVCCLRPGVPGVSDNIRVFSVLGRFLEHSRVYYFYNGGQSKVYIGSADVMTRNIDRRVETLLPILDASLAERIERDILAQYLATPPNTWQMRSDGSYERIESHATDSDALDVQSNFMKLYAHAAAEPPLID
jgi:polyphosphate kinase